MIPLSLKVVYTLFVCAPVPIYCRQYGPANFLWFSDIALLVLVPALWLENALLASMMGISVVFFEALWNIDFFFQLLTGKSLIGLSAYTFDPKIPLFIRLLSCFHIVCRCYFSGCFTGSATITGLFLANNCGAGDPAALLSGEQPTRERELGVWIRPKSSADSARAVFRDSSDAAISARCLSTNAPYFRQDFSSRRDVKTVKRTLRRHST